MKINVNKGGIKIKLERPLSAREVWNKILDVQIQALEQLLEERSLDKWKDILPCYGSSLEDAEKRAFRYIEIFKGYQGKTYDENPMGIEEFITYGIPQKWFNTLMSILFMMEEELMKQSSEAVFELWDLFFTVQAKRNENHVLTMGLIDFKLK